MNIDTYENSRIHTLLEHSVQSGASATDEKRMAKKTQMRETKTRPPDTLAMHNIHIWSICTHRNTMILCACVCLQLLADEQTFTAMSETKGTKWQLVSIGWRNGRIVFICALQQSTLRQCDFHSNFFSNDFIYRLHKISTCNAQRNCFRRNYMSVVGTTPKCCTQPYFVAIVTVLS